MFSTINTLSLNFLFCSSHQEWIVNVLLDGMRDMEDFLLCLNSMVFKMILDYYSSTLAAEKIKVCSKLQRKVDSGTTNFKFKRSVWFYLFFCSSD